MLPKPSNTDTILMKLKNETQSKTKECARLRCPGGRGYKRSYAMVG